MALYSFEGVVPWVHPTAYVHPTAVLIGDVRVGAGCYVGPHASLRGDFGAVVMHPGSNVQDSVTMHCFPDSDVTIEENGHVGHGSVLHGCHVGHDALIGINAVLLDRCVVGARAFVGANSLVRGGMRVPDDHLAHGSPAAVVRELTEDEKAWKLNGTRAYHELARRSLATVHEVDAGDPQEPTGPRLAAWVAAIPVEEYRAARATPPA
jgi:carbonic anhydrase/acetyltransferase-like protein (isoleucine patch superfamily)